MSDLTFAADYKLLLQSLPHADPVFLGDIVITDFHHGGQSTRRVNRLALRLETRRVVKELGYPIPWNEWWWRLTKAAVWFVLLRLAGQRGQMKIRQNRSNLPGGRFTECP